LKFLKTYAPSRDKSGQGNQKQDKDADESNKQPNLPNGTHEQSAKEAAEYGGMFIDLSSPFEEFFHFIDNGIEEEEEQTLSPFYFRGRNASSNQSTTTREVFLKVWRADEVDIDSVISEWKHHNLAITAGIPVAKPLLSKPAVSTCSRGFAYIVFAMEFIHEDYIETIDDLWSFCCSLFQSVLMLHRRAHMLHCDIKPGNFRWNREEIRLIDFGHAEDITNARWMPGTEGYQAPEILNEMACSTKTDAFSVGKTISRECRAFGKGKVDSQEKQIYLTLLDISVKLSHPNPDDVGPWVKHFLQ
jgi:hypothetical protein